MFEVDGGSTERVEVRDHDWHDVILELPRREFAVINIVCSRTWCPEPNVPEAFRRDLGVGYSIKFHSGAERKTSSLMNIKTFLCLDPRRRFIR
jgi:hypothetical protein